ncbi:asparagine synthase (glutamine-hydrolyzing) [Bosea minatitlanensis]|uniref:asparagine synthase (glutamine-hydrolyzing) n=1 Tax=Bosea minatitlanensis TaxID=128782 RepID=A0ABW0F8V6_9HYPH|nr:asparagine synthase (glutamine-hydrolyzing) [Bosea minatitlanensis]MCT4493014.1 asparagine synthase (glutamine-hydrolyzing) [Bosea minatitlanensis]
MCGIAGFVRIGRTAGPPLPSPESLDRMIDTLAHRGPDARGVWYDEVRGVGFGHRRLSIRDLSPAGAQPMMSSCGRFVIIYNGEIYSHDEIAADLAGTGRTLRGHSDTEIMLEAFAEWGVERVLPRLIGMFAFALFDKETGELVLARDRLGIKPLYWSAANGLLLFGSELKPLRAVPSWTPVVDRSAMASFMRHNYIPAPLTIYKGVQKLEPGTLLRARRDGSVTVEPFWNLRTIAEKAVASPSNIADGDALDRLDKLLLDAVRRRLVADVPIGALLSGGIDSSLVTALMTETTGGKINTFSIGFSEKGYDEAPYAREIARYLGTQHTELYAKAEHALGMVEKLPHWYDEPFADSSQLPTALVCELTRQHVKVVLSGDGGDELFAGYSRYPLALDLWRKQQLAPSPLRTIAAHGLLAMPAAILDKLGQILPSRLRQDRFGSKAKRYATALLSQDPDGLYRQMLSHWHAPETVVIGGDEMKGTLWDKHLQRTVPDFLDRMMLFDTLTYLPDDILTKVDRASMAVALEARVPLLDHRVVEFAWRLPQHMKVRDGVSKWALRQVLYRRVPRELLDRPKMGFGVPLAAWLRGPLRDWTENLLSEARLKQQGLFHPEPIRERWQAHLSGADWAYPLWNVLMAQSWLDANPEVVL